MQWVLVISSIMIPLVMIGIISYGLLQGVNVYDAFADGAKDGLVVVVKLLPTLIGLMMAVGMLRTSGALDGITRMITPLLSWTKFPQEVIPIALMRSVSAAASVGLVLDAFQTYGPDSFIGRLISIMFGCTETVFYTMSVYFMAIKIKKMRYTLAGALIATLSGIVASYYLTMWIFGG